MDKTSKIPLYLQLMEKLISMIEKKFILEGEKLPPERELCKIYGVSRITVRQALHELEREGYIYRIQGAGAFISSRPYDQKLVKLYNFTEEMKKKGRNPSTRIIKFDSLIADERLAKKINIPSFEEVYKVIRLQFADDEPLIYETTFLPKRLFPDLTKTTLYNRSMYKIFYEDYGLGVTRAIESFSATTLRDEEANYLQLPPGRPAMLIKRLAYHNDQLIGYTISVSRGDKFEYIVELT
ncbi:MULTISPECIES: GntR family transcriptional regulator [Clostridia]|uniref:GntR family transcriptional regulator n=1 Tax=Clostridia TaxID=186801 RepID=UPI000EA32C74|nr:MULTISPECIES: GntR family transcriptional regulator [Clostridia]NBJ70370.1 GntR family transcriptional regulator [Roseburia sp. 1XD42-34]RKI76366.1 GntR family transcriptional regulator [Clostridium sp. 1xD42-85]